MLTSRNVGNIFSLSEELISGNNNLNGKNFCLHPKKLIRSLIVREILEQVNPTFLAIEDQLIDDPRISFMILCILN